MLAFFAFGVGISEIFTWEKRNFWWKTGKMTQKLYIQEQKYKKVINTH